MGGEFAEQGADNTGKRRKLAVTRTNLETSKSGIFSSDTSGNFPVADAVRISMSLPLAYKPVAVRPEDDRGRAFRDWHHGLWVDDATSITCLCGPSTNGWHRCDPRVAA